MSEAELEVGFGKIILRGFLLCLLIVPLVIFYSGHYEELKYDPGVSSAGSAVMYTVTSPCAYGLADVPLYSLDGINSEIHGSGEYSGSSSMSGSFFLGMGSVRGSGSESGSFEIDQEPYYYFYVREHHSGYILKSLPAKSTFIIESDEIAPILRNIGVTDSREPVWGGVYSESPAELNLRYCLESKTFEIWDGNLSQIIKYEKGKNYLIVPKGTIIQKYEVN